MIKSKRRKNRCRDKWILKLTEIVHNLEKRHTGVKIVRNQNHIEICPIFGVPTLEEICLIERNCRDIGETSEELRNRLTGG